MGRWAVQDAGTWTWVLFVHSEGLGVGGVGCGSVWWICIYGMDHYEGKRIGNIHA